MTYLDTVTCRCTKKNGWSYNKKRNMWVCGDCGKPSVHNSIYVTECIYCAEDLVPIVSDDAGNNEICNNCGGTNQMFEE